MDRSIRSATVADAAAIALINVRAWRSAYAGLLDPAVLADLDVAERTAVWTTRLDAPHDGPRLVVAVDGGVVGYLIGAHRTATTAAEVMAIYVDPAYWRDGVGTTLLAAGVDALRARGTTAIVLWVLDGNARARRFYEAHGWRFDGGRRDDPIGDRLASHVRYRLD